MNQDANTGWRRGSEIGNLDSSEVSKLGERRDQCDVESVTVDGERRQVDELSDVCVAQDPPTGNLPSNLESNKRSGIDV